MTSRLLRDHAHVNLRAVADKAGVSLATASRAVNGSASVTAETAARVRAAVEKLGYSPNAFVTTLMRSVRNERRVPDAATIAWINHHAPADDVRLNREPVAAALAAGARARATELGFKLTEFSPLREHLTSRRLTTILQSRGIAGALVLEDVALPEGGAVLPVEDDGIAVVTVGYRHCLRPVPFSQNDQFASGRIATQRMLALGYRRIGFLSSAWIEDRVEGRFRAGVSLALAEAGLPPPDMHLLPSEIEDHGHPAALAWMKRRRLDGVLTVFRHSRLQKRLAATWTPPGVGLATLDWSADAPEMAGIAQDHTMVGAMAMALLATRIGQRDMPSLHTGMGVIVEGAWRDGNSLPDRSIRRR
jgi:DNA-binding LacI/PurR family transcriptional regulator